jgi:hypothetical protein
MELGDEQLVALLDLVKGEWNDATIETDVEFYCNLYLKLRNEHESRFQKVH